MKAKARVFDHCAVVRVVTEITPGDWAALEAEVLSLFKKVKFIVCHFKAALPPVMLPLLKGSLRKKVPQGCKLVVTSEDMKEVDAKNVIDGLKQIPHNTAKKISEAMSLEEQIHKATSQVKQVNSIVQVQIGALLKKEKIEDIITDEEIEAQLLELKKNVGQLKHLRGSFVAEIEKLKGTQSALKADPENKAQIESELEALEKSALKAVADAGVF